MFSSLNSLISSGFGEYILVGSVFLFSVTLFFAGYLFLWPSVEVTRRVAASTGAAGVAGGTGVAGGIGIAVSGELDERDSRLREEIETFYASLQTADINAISRRLIRAGYFNKSAIWYFYAIRITAAILTFFGIFFLVRIIFDDITLAIAGYTSGTLSLLALILPGFVLDRMGSKQEERYRRAFPDFMDILIVCADAGLSLEAGVARVAEEMLATNREFGIHLNIMMLEIRAGRRLRDALSSFADRLALEEARSLATVFKQSEELGSSLTETLRVFSHEMRRERIVKAEEKANKLPVKMIFPLGLFLFPVMLMVIIFPVLLTLLQIIGQNAPG